MGFLLHIIVLICVRLFACLGLNLILGKTKILHFAHVAFIIPVYYVMYSSMVLFHVHPVLSFLMSVITAMLTALLLAELSLRLPEDAYGVLSIALHLMFLSVIFNWQSVTRGALGIPKIPRLILPEGQLEFTVVITIAAVLWILFVWWVDRGPFGRQMQALSEHPWYTESLGISKRRVHTIVFLASGVGVLLNMLFYAPYVRIVTPQDFNFPTIILYVTIIVAGGPGKLWGSVISCIVLTFLGEGIRFIDMPVHLIGPLRLMLFGLILFGAVWWRRDSLFPQQRSV